MNYTKHRSTTVALFLIATAVTLFAGVFTAQKVKSYTGFAASTLVQTAKTSNYYSYYKMATSKEDYNVFLGLINSVLLTNNSKNIELINDLPEILAKTYNTNTYNVRLTESFLKDNTLILKGSCADTADATELAHSLQAKYYDLYFVEVYTEDLDADGVIFEISLTPID